MVFKGDFQFVLHNLSTLINIRNLTSVDGMRIDVIHFKSHTLSLRVFKFFLQQLHGIFTPVKLFHQAIRERTKHKASHHNGI